MFLVIYDNEKDKAIQFSSDLSFGFKEAYHAVRNIRKSSQPQNLEHFCNTDYRKFELTDFRSLRYMRKDNGHVDEDLSMVSLEDDLNDNVTTQEIEEEKQPLVDQMQPP